MATEHTPGPWRVEEAETGDGTHIVYAGNALIAETGDGDQLANARLIAAAPALLAAAEAALVRFDHDAGDKIDYSKLIHAIDVRADLRAAIQQARTR